MSLYSIQQSGSSAVLKGVNLEMFLKVTLLAPPSLKNGVVLRYAVRGLHNVFTTPRVGPLGTRASGRLFLAPHSKFLDFFFGGGGAV